jgi:Tfp pilus assembly protein PilF
MGASSVTERVTEWRSAKRTRTVTVRPDKDLARSRAPILSARRRSVGRKTLSSAGLLPSATREKRRPSWDRAVAADASLWRAWAGLGRAHDQRKDWTAAGGAYERGLKANPGSPVILNNQGMSLLLQHRYAEAAAAFEQAIAHDPTLDTARANLRIALAGALRRGAGRPATGSAGELAQ